MTPFKEFVCDPGRARGRFVRSGCQMARYFLLGDGCEWAGWDRGGKADGFAESAGAGGV